MDNSYPKDEKLKSKKIIDLLFTEGKSVGKYPLRLVYIPYDFEEAVDRNYYKRVLRECYRLNKSQLTVHLNQKYCFMFFYQTADRLTYQEIALKTQQLFEKFGKSVSQ
jgi:ribonuclease P protein component